MKKSKPIDPMEPVKDGSEKDYEANNAYDTIMRAQQHMGDEDMMKRVSKVADRHMEGAQQIKSVADIKKARAKMFPPKKRYEKVADTDKDGG